MFYKPVFTSRAETENHNHDLENVLSLPFGCFENTMALRVFHLAHFFLKVNGDNDWVFLSTLKCG